VFPEALDRPTVMTIIGFGKRLAHHLLGKDEAAQQMDAAKPSSTKEQAAAAG
jgi:hypothetical protein